MKIIEAMKKCKDIARKRDDLVAKIKVHCAHLSHETPAYADQKSVVAGWVQSAADSNKEILRLRIAIQRTNLATPVTIALNDEDPPLTVTKTIAEWVLRRRELAAQDAKIWATLGDRGLKEGTIQNSQGQAQEVKIVRCYDPVLRDVALEVFRSEPSRIDAALEVVNAVTDLQE